MRTLGAMTTTGRCVIPMPLVRSLVVVPGIILSLLGCKDLTGNPGLAAGTPDPSSYNNGAGAFGMRNAAVAKFEIAFPQYIIDAGLLTDELQNRVAGSTLGTVLFLAGNNVIDPIDQRILNEGEPVQSDNDYYQLQTVRSLVNQAIGQIALSDTATSDTATTNSLIRGKAWRGELYGLEGYAEMMLADFFCSGVPLSTLDFHGDYTYRAGSRTDQVYQDASAKFDTALVLGAATDSIVNLARVGKGRALLDLGQYAAAAAAVAAVPTGFQYNVIVNFGANFHGVTVADTEGKNGLPYRSSGDPRTAVVPNDYTETPSGGNVLTFNLLAPQKYNSIFTSGITPVTLASGVEARLIEAEAALQSNAQDGTWITILKTLHDTLSGGTVTPLTDPGTEAGLDSARVALLFQERDFCLFLSGDRQGDLRRLLRQFPQFFRLRYLVYPTCQYLPGTIQVYGSEVTAPIPEAEHVNQLFHGCLNRAP